MKVYIAIVNDVRAEIASDVTPADEAGLLKLRSPPRLRPFLD
jgi:hypothetical protein